MCKNRTQVFKLTDLQCLDLSRNIKYKLGLAVTAFIGSKQSYPQGWDCKDDQKLKYADLTVKFSFCL